MENLLKKGVAIKVLGTLIKKHPVLAIAALVKKSKDAKESKGGDT
jgi:hypothetical protein